MSHIQVLQSDFLSYHLSALPTFSHIPNLVTIILAILVALSKSLEAPMKEETTCAV